VLLCNIVLQRWTPYGAHVRRPRLDYESHATALDRDEVGALLVAAGPDPATR
jgi:hypothetical protein